MNHDNLFKAFLANNNNIWVFCTKWKVLNKQNDQTYDMAASWHGNFLRIPRSLWMECIGRGGGTVEQIE